MANTSDIRNGLCIDHNNHIYSIVSFQHVKPGKGNAFVRTKLKRLKTGKLVEHTFPAGHKIHEVRVERRKYQYLYKDDMGYNFMNTETYDQIAIDGAMIDNAGLMKEGSEVEILFHSENETPLTLDMPAHVIMKIKYTEPGIRGDTATNVMKPATLETGHEVKVPLFINIGDSIKIDTRTGDYLERVKV